MFLKAGTDFEDNGETVSDTYFFIPEIGTSKDVEKYSFPDSRIATILKKTTQLGYSMTLQT